MLSLKKRAQESLHSDHQIHKKTSTQEYLAVSERIIFKNMTQTNPPNPGIIDYDGEEPLKRRMR